MSELRKKTRIPNEALTLLLGIVKGIPEVRSAQCQWHHNQGVLGLITAH